ncbi:lycopene cyclase domain-containing protein [Bacteroidota bacterium]
MKYEYLIFNLIVISGPLFFGSFKKFYIINKWKDLIISIIPVAVLFLIWDSLVTGRHWEFNPSFITGIIFFKLPLEEILFFITVPFACLFTWEMIIRRKNNTEIPALKHFRFILFFLPIAGLILFFLGKEYTGLALFFLGITAYADKLTQSNLFLQKRFYLYLSVLTFFTMIFNGYLTWRPVVVYDESYQLGLRIFSVPIEDLIYGFSLIVLSTIIFTKISVSKLDQFGDNISQKRKQFKTTDQFKSNFI